MELIVIHNREAGSGDWDAKRIRRMLRAAGHDAAVVSTKKAWRRVVRLEEPDAFVAAGGDGTVHRLIHELDGRAIGLAIMPLGTANNVAHALGYHTGDDVEQRIGCWRDNATTLHLGRVGVGDEARTCVESVGVGAFVEMRRKGRRERPDGEAVMSLLGIRRALVEKLLAADPVTIETRIDGAAASGDYLLLECLNLPYFGPRLHLAERERADEPLITVCGIPAEERQHAAQWIATGQGNAHDWVVGRGAVVELTADARTHVDGDVWPGRDARGVPLRIMAGATKLRVMV